MFLLKNDSLEDPRDGKDVFRRFGSGGNDEA